MAINGDDTNNILNGTAGNDRINGRGGDDILTGGGGNDRLNGGDGDDTLSGGAGNDRIVPGAGADIVFGGAGNDRIVGYESGDTLDGGAGVDKLSLRPDDAGIGASAAAYNLTAVSIERFAGSDNADHVSAAGASERVSLAGRGGDDVLTGGDGNDRLYGGDGADTLNGGAGKDRLEGGDGVDTLNGGDGDDDIVGYTTGDVIDGGAGVDKLSLRVGDPGLGASGAAFDITAASIERFRGSDNADNVQAAAAVERVGLSGRGGDDTLTGGSGDDRLNGGDGNDVLRGGAGNDRIADGAGIDILIGGAGNDTFVLTDSNAFGDNGIRYDASRPWPLLGGEGTDTVEARNAIEGIHIADLIFGQASIERFKGSAHDDIVNAMRVDHAVRLNGRDGDDKLTGGSGNDRINGGNGNDVLNGNGGRDRLDGGNGNDSFHNVSNADIVLGGAGTDLVRNWGERGLGTESNAFDMAAASIERVITSEGTFHLDARGQSEGVQITSYGETTAHGSEHTDVMNAIWGSDGDANAFYGHGGNDKLSGSGLGDILNGGAGADRLAGGGGDDVLTGGLGADQFIFRASETGHDIVQDLNFEQGDSLRFEGVHGSGRSTFDSLAGLVEANVTHGIAMAENADGTGVVMTLDGDSAIEFVFGPIGRNLIQVDDEDRHYVNTAGADVVYGDVQDNRITTTSGTDYIYGGEGNDNLNGYHDNDFVFGQGGNDNLSGGHNQPDADVLLGGAGDDKLTPDWGSDIMFGGAGADVFNVVKAMSGDVNWILDFESGVDRLVVEKHALMGTGVAHGWPKLDTAAEAEAFAAANARAVYSELFDVYGPHALDGFQLAFHKDDAAEPTAIINVVTGNSDSFDLLV